VAGHRTDRYAYTKTPELSRGYPPAMKTCSRCRESKPHAAFQRNSARKDGLQATCRDCRRAIDADQYRLHKPRYDARKHATRRHNVEAVQAYKMANACSDCGGHFHFAAMQFDHRPGEEKTMELAHLAARGSPARIAAEMAKCDLVCANCHAVRTFLRRVGGIRTLDPVGPTDVRYPCATTR
jgi:hypothetical protein